jgi:hypothetical protein
MLLKLYVYGYLNRVPSSRRLEREAGRNVELMWLTGKLAPDHKTIANFRKDHGPAIQAACAHFVVLCRQIGLFTQALAAVDGSKFKAVNTRDKNFTKAKLKARMAQVEASIERYMAAMETADRQDGEIAQAKSVRLRGERVSASDHLGTPDLRSSFYTASTHSRPSADPCYASPAGLRGAAWKSTSRSWRATGASSPLRSARSSAAS